MSYFNILPIYNTLYEATKNLYDIISPLIPLKTVNQLDPQKYIGKWCEWYRKPNLFQNYSQGCATYEITDSNTIKVFNEQQGSTISGKAVITNPGKLLVTFDNIFYAPYWVIGLIENDENTRYDIAIVSDPLRVTFWVLAREGLNKELYKDRLNNLLINNYFIFKDLIKFE